MMRGAGRAWATTTQVCRQAAPTAGARSRPLSRTSLVHAAKHGDDGPLGTGRTTGFHGDAAGPPVTSHTEKKTRSDLPSPAQDSAAALANLGVEGAPQDVAAKQWGLPGGEERGDGGEGGEEPPTDASPTPPTKEDTVGGRLAREEEAESGPEVHDRETWTFTASRATLVDGLLPLRALAGWATSAWLARGVHGGTRDSASLTPSAGGVDNVQLRLGPLHHVTPEEVAEGGREAAARSALKHGLDVVEELAGRLPPSPWSPVHERADEKSGGATPKRGAPSTSTSSAQACPAPRKLQPPAARVNDVAGKGAGQDPDIPHHTLEVDMYPPGQREPGPRG